MMFLKLTHVQAIKWLDKRTPEWRTEPPPVPTPIVVYRDKEELEDE